MPKILAIDDKRDNLITISALLKHFMADCEVITAQSGLEGIELAASELPDTVILDVKMPGMDGFEVCRVLKSSEATRSIPIILLTAIRTDTESRITGLELGADAFLTKPIDESELIAQIKVMLRIKNSEDLLRREKDLLEVLVQERTSELVKSERELIRERDFIRSLEDASPAYYVAVDSEGAVITMSRSMLGALGLTIEQARGTHFLETFVQEGDREMAAQVFSLLYGNKKVPLSEIALLTSEGREILVEWEGRPFHAPDGQLKFIFFVGIDVTERKRLEKIIMDDNERERNRIGQDLHDGLGQHLAGIAFKSEILRLKLKDRGWEDLREVDEVVMLVNQAINQARDLAKGLCPVDRTSGGLRSALEDLCSSTARTFGISCLLDWNEDVDLPADMEGSHLYYIAREAVNNAVKHASPKNVIVSLSQEQGAVVMKITDDGTGIPDLHEERPGMGLKIMNYRAWIIGASFSASRMRSGGTEIVCVLRTGTDSREKSLAEEVKKRLAESDPGKKAQILVVDDHPIVRQGLAQIINRESDLFVCGEAKSADETVRLVPRLSPDLLIVDISLEGSSGLDLIKAMKARYPALPALVLSIYDESLYAERAIRAGARGYVMKQEAPQAVVTAIRTVLSGKQYLSENLRRSLMERNPFDETARSGPSIDSLTTREFEIFQLLGQGLSNKPIADRLNISVKTVENFRDRIKNKLNMENSAEVVRFAVQWTLSQGRLDRQAEDGKKGES